MFRKVTIATMLAVVLVSMFTVTAYAAEGDFTAIVNQANDRIEYEINKAIDEANDAQNSTNGKIAYTNLLLKKGFISQNEADGRIRNYQADLNNYINAIGSRLIARTDAIAVGVIQEGKRRGIMVICTYVKVNLAGHIFLIDPLRIVGN